ncbi:MAG: hypothetical protein CW335_01925 [Clostridiales bacterium]|nr:hypothetical protein [Clostridiales bacterium]
MTILHPTVLAEFTPENVDSVRKYLAQMLLSPYMNDRCSRNYEMMIVSFIENNEWTFEAASYSLKRICAEVKTDSSSWDISYAAFYALCTYYRKYSHLTEYRALLNEYCTFFEGETSYQFLELMCRSASASQSPCEMNRKLLSDAEKLRYLVGLERNYGVTHLYTEIVAIYYESFLQKDLPTDDLSCIDGAIDYATQALDASRADNADHGYPKFYMTRARLLYLKAIFEGDETGSRCFEKAHKDVGLAIDYEESTQKMSAYRLKESSLRFAYYEEKLRKQVNNLGETFRELDSASTKKNLELLSFFAAILSLIITGASFAAKTVFPQSAFLLLIMTGCICVAFGAFGFIINNKDRKGANIILLLIGLLLVAGAIICGCRIC